MKKTRRVKRKRKPNGGAFRAARGNRLLKISRLFLLWRPVVTRLLSLGAMGVTLLSPSLTQTAVANGDTRTIYLHHAHTNESIAATYLVNGEYDTAVLKQLNWFLRDWRRDEPTNMDPRLFDVVWEAYRGAGGANQEINVVSAYRSPETNAMLRSRSRAVAKYSQHMLGKAMDTTMPGMPMSRIREVGMRMQRGGVGYYPTAGTPFVHLDVGNVRHWPRMSFDQLSQLFPDGKTVHIPSNGQPLARYEEARAEIEARGDGAFVTAPRFGLGNFFARLFGGGSEEDDNDVAPPPPKKQWGLVARKGRAAQVETETADEGAAGPETREIARAEADLPRGETVMRAPDSQPSESAEIAKDQFQNDRVKAPLPPNRPTFLSARLTTNDTPISPERALSMATLGENGLSHSNDEREIGVSRQRRLTKAPTPPKRPSIVAARGVGITTGTAVATKSVRQQKVRTDETKPSITTAAPTAVKRPQQSMSPKTNETLQKLGSSAAQTRPASVAPLGGLRAAAHAQPPAPQQ